MAHQPNIQYAAPAPVAVVPYGNGAHNMRPGANNQAQIPGNGTLIGPISADMVAMQARSISENVHLIVHPQSGVMIPTLQGLMPAQFSFNIFYNAAPTYSTAAGIGCSAKMVWPMDEAQQEQNHEYAVSRY